MIVMGVLWGVGGQPTWWNRSCSLRDSKAGRDSSRFQPSAVPFKGSSLSYSAIRRALLLCDPPCFPNPLPSIASAPHLSCSFEAQGVGEALGACDPIPDLTPPSAIAFYPNVSASYRALPTLCQTALGGLWGDDGGQAAYTG